MKFVEVGGGVLYVMSHLADYLKVGAKT
jgi:hypothetical protein